MGTSLRRFCIELYEEHLEEASALYGLRNALLVEPNREWRSLHDFEERLEAHIDALVIGGALALETCAGKMRDGDAGELFAGLCVCCREEDAALFARVWKQLDCGDVAKVRAVTEALKFELPDTWADAASQALDHADGSRFPILAVAAAYRQLPLGSYVAARLMTANEVADPHSVWALGRMQGQGAAPALERCLQSSDSNVRAHALRGLLRAGDSHALQRCYQVAESEDWPHLAMGLGGNRHAAAILARQVEGGRGTRETVLALGLLGDVSTVRVLVKVLDSEALGDLAAMALHWITGAPLHEDVFVPDPVDESELFEAETAAWRERGEVPRRADGRPFGSDVRQLTRDGTVWNQWLADHANQFQAGLRYRLGQPYSLGSLYECLTIPDAPHEWRQLAHEELVVRYGCPVAFEADARVVDQLAALKRMAHWVGDQESRLKGDRGKAR